MGFRKDECHQKNEVSHSVIPVLLQTHGIFRCSLNELVRSSNLFFQPYVWFVITLILLCGDLSDHFQSTFWDQQMFIIIIINSLTARVVGAPLMMLQPIFSIFPCFPLPSGTCWTPSKCCIHWNWEKWSRNGKMSLLYVVIVIRSHSAPAKMETTAELYSQQFSSKWSG